MYTKNLQIQNFLYVEIYKNGEIWNKSQKSFLSLWVQEVSAFKGKGE